MVKSIDNRYDSDTGYVINEQIESHLSKLPKMKIKAKKQKPVVKKDITKLTQMYN